MLRLGIIGLSPGNGHPYSWSAICNGYDPKYMEKCGFPVIPKYLAQQKWPAARLPGVEVTHVWTQERELSERISLAGRIAHIVDQPEDMLGQIDALLLARDDAENHLEFAKPFLQSGLPVYIDKPMALDVETFDALHSLQTHPGQIFTCSAVRFASEMRLSPEQATGLGPLTLVTGTTPKCWDTYAMHLIDPLLRFSGISGQPRRLFSSSIGVDGRILGVQMGEKCPDIVLTVLGSNSHAPLEFVLHGELGCLRMKFGDSFSAFRSALGAFLDHCRRGGTPRHEYETYRRAVEILEMGRI